MIDLARNLQRALRHLPVVMLHDRRLPTGVLLEHVAIGPGGVTIVAELGERIGPPRAAWLREMHRRVEVIERLIDDFAPVAGALCLTYLDPHEGHRALEVDDVLIAGPQAVAAFAAREGDLRDYELATVVELLDARCPPALN